MLNKKALAASVSAPPAEFVEDVFSTYLYTGNNADGGFNTQTITNGIDLAGKGGLTWIKDRSDSNVHCLFDTTRGVLNRLVTNNADAQGSLTQSLTAFNSTGFTVGRDFNGSVNRLGYPYCSWTFREQPKFFDVVTYTGNATNRTIAHNLGSVPGMIIVKRLNDAADWTVYHRSLGPTLRMFLNGTQAALDGTASWNSTAPTSTDFSLGVSSAVNSNGGTFVAYLFAHNAGGFGTTGTDNVISCGTYTGNGSSTGPSINLGYEPQWLMVKRTDGAADWYIVDNMRGFPVGSNVKTLKPNLSEAEGEAITTGFEPTATGFNVRASWGAINDSGGTYIYMAIRRPMKVPTDATTVFAPVIWTGNTATPSATRSLPGFGRPTDLFIGSERVDENSHNFTFDRLRGVNTNGGRVLQTNVTSAEYNTGESGTYSFAQNDGFTLGNYFINYTGRTHVGWMFGRASGFFDVVCYTANSVDGRTINHNLTVVPEFTIFKSRGATSQWYVWHNSFSLGQEMYLSLPNEISAGGIFTSTPTTNAMFISSANINASSFLTVVAYLFATLAGVSKVGSYTGNGSSQTINCGFTAGARFVLIKRTDSTGDWYVWDTARGIVTGNDPHLSLNTTAAEVTTNDSVDPDNSGFIVNQLAATNINVSSATYIYLAIA
jgi:hypothetical protein